MKSFKRNIKVTVTPTSGDAYTFEGAMADEFISQFNAGTHVITVLDPETGAKTMINIDCVCSAKVETTKGEEYKPQDCESLFCDPQEG